jgi:Arc/MetJ-type ribon-helix-helix transcriptional regulator
MNSIDDEFDKLKDRIKNTVYKVLEGLKTSFSQVYEVEGRIWSEKNSFRLWELLKEVKNLKHQAREEVKKLRETLIQEFKDFRKKIRAVSFDESEGLKHVENKLLEFSEFLDKCLDEAGDRLREFTDKAEEIEDKIRSRIKELKGESVSVMAFKVPGGEVRIPDIGKLIESSLSKAWSNVPSMVVSSVRLPKADLELIDALVEAGIFKSRNEGIAFFAHKGIEASRDWLNKVKEKIEEIKRLQEEAKKEMEKMFGEERN